MGLFGRSMLDEGYYIEDSYGDMTKVEIKGVLSGEYDRETLYRHDGYSMDRIGEINLFTKDNLNNNEIEP